MNGCSVLQEAGGRSGRWCEDNNPNTAKAKELIVDFRKDRGPHQPRHI